MHDILTPSTIGEKVNDHDMDGKSRARAYQHQQMYMIFTARFPMGHAQQVQANHGQANRARCAGTALLLKKKKPQDRDNDDTYEQ